MGDKILLRRDAARVQRGVDRNPKTDALRQPTPLQQLLRPISGTVAPSHFTPAGTVAVGAALYPRRHLQSGEGRMQGYATSFGIGFVAGMRSMTACAALTWAAA